MGSSWWQDEFPCATASTTSPLIGGAPPRQIQHGTRRKGILRRYHPENKLCRLIDLEEATARNWLLALIRDTGMRLSEAAGLHRDDIILDATTPHINLTAHPWRRLKTKDGARHIPLVGTSLWAPPTITNDIITRCNYSSIHWVFQITTGALHRLIRVICWR